MFKLSVVEKPQLDPAHPPSLESVSPRLAKVMDKLREIGEKRAAIAAGLDEVRVGLINHPPGAVMSQSPRRTVVIEPSERAKELLGDLSPEPIIEIRNAGNALRARADELSAEMDVINEAIAALEPEHRRAKHEASAILCDMMRPAYDRVCARLIEAIVALADARQEHAEFVRRIERTGASIAALRVLDSIELLGNAADTYSPLLLALRRAVETNRADPAILTKWRPLK